METAFSHRREDGISVGVRVVDGKAFIAAAFRSPEDQFNGKLARRIINGRIDRGITKVAAGEQIADNCLFWDFYGVPEGTTARDIMNPLRMSFKPDPYETDATFCVEWTENEITCRQNVYRDIAWNLIFDMFKTQCKLINESVSA